MVRKGIQGWAYTTHICRARRLELVIWVITRNLFEVNCLRSWNIKGLERPGKWLEDPINYGWIS